MLQEGVSNHCHQDMAMKTLPGSPFEVIKSELLLQLLMRLLTNPSCLNGGGQCAQIRRRREIGEIVFLFPGGTLLANEPSFVALGDAADPYPISAAEGRRRCGHGEQQIGLSADLSSRCANPRLSILRWPTFVLPQSIRYLARGVFVVSRGLW